MKKTVGGIDFTRREAAVAMGIMLEGRVKLNTEDYIEFVDTGGYNTNTFNISTTSIFVCATARVIIAKNGNKAATSRTCQTQQDYIIEDLRGSDGNENAEIARAILNGGEKGAKSDIIIVNCVAGIYWAARRIHTRRRINEGQCALRYRDI